MRPVTRKQQYALDVFLAHYRPDADYPRTSAEASKLIGEVKDRPKLSACRALLVPVEGPVQEVELDGTLAQLQQLVGGGYIEAVPVPDFIAGHERATAYINDDGKAMFEPNMRATDFMVPGFGMLTGDWVAGPFLLCGFDPIAGEHTERIPEAVVKRARLIEREAGI